MPFIYSLNLGLSHANNYFLLQTQNVPIQEHVQHKSKTWEVLICRLGSGHLQVFQGRLKGAGEAIAMQRRWLKEQLP